MTRLRVLVFFLTIIVVITFGTLFGFYARGYRFDPKTFKFAPNGILVIRSDPEAAQIFIDGELKTATNATLSLPPGEYEISIRKDGYFTWEKTLVIEKEIVTEANITLFRTAPALSPATFSPSINPITTSDYTKIAYTVPFNQEDPEKGGLWVIETINLPLGFSRDPRRITDGDLSNTTYEFSPNGRQIMLTKTTAGTRTLAATEVSYLLDATTFTPQAQLTGLSAVKKQETLDLWEEEKLNKLTAQLRPLHPELIEIFTNNATSISFSPDENKILYIASSSASLKEDLVKQLPGSSTQRQDRDIKPGNTYVYDIKEDRNFLISDQPQGESLAIRWFPTSRHVVITEPDKVAIADYDGTNSQVVYSGVYSAPFAYPFVNTNRLLILTNLGANSNPPNLYSLTVK